jgi:hypothetical protein
MHSPHASLPILPLAQDNCSVLGQFHLPSCSRTRASSRRSGSTAETHGILWIPAFAGMTMNPFSSGKLTHYQLFRQLDPPEGPMLKSGSFQREKLLCQ